MLGELIIFLSKIIANLFPIFSLVIFPNFLPPLLLNSKDTTGELVSNVGKAFINKSPDIVFLFFTAYKTGLPDGSNTLSDS